MEIIKALSTYPYINIFLHHVCSMKKTCGSLLPLGYVTSSVQYEAHERIVVLNCFIYFHLYADAKKKRIIRIRHGIFSKQQFILDKVINNINLFLNPLSKMQKCYSSVCFVVSYGSTETYPHCSCANIPGRSPVLSADSFARN